MAGDPQVYTDEAQPGKIKHTFTGLRQQFPNQAIHSVILQRILPFRREMFLRPEFQQEQRWETNLVTLFQRGLTDISDAVKEYTDRNSASDVNKSLDERAKDLADFINKANAKDKSLETLAKDVAATHADEQTQPADQRIGSLHFDYTGNNPDYPQPTPGRMPNGSARVVVVGIDRLIVLMSNSHSADHPKTINEHDAAVFQSHLADLFNVIQRAGEVDTPYYPTSLRRSQLDGVFNADGAHDPDINDGSGQQGDTVNNPQAGS